MKPYALLTVTGPDRPGIVARLAKVMFETGSNIEDSAMTRLGGEFTVMLIVRPGVALPILEGQLRLVAEEMNLALFLQEITGTTAMCPTKAVDECLITVLGADKPGIVYHVTQLLETLGGNIVDLSTKVIGCPTRPVYLMTIEAEIPPPMELIVPRFRSLATELSVEITVRSAQTFPM